VRKAKTGRLLDGRTYDEYPRRFAAPVPEKSICATFAEHVRDSARNMRTRFVPITA